MKKVILALFVLLLSGCQLTIGTRFIDSWEDNQEGGKLSKSAQSQYQGKGS